MTTTQVVIDGDRLALSGSDDMDIQFVEVAGKTALIIDNVYKDPDYVRGLALSLNYNRQAGAYPGYFAFISISASPLLDLANTLMSEVIGDYLTFTRSYKDDVIFAVITKRGSELSPEQRRPHVDDFCDYAGLVYLNPPGQCFGGTSFWRHRPTGMEEVASGATLPQPAGDDSAAEYLSESTETWERRRVLAMAYNRFVLYSSNLIHSPLYSERDFGGELSARRLTQNLYFDKWQVRRAKLASSASRR